MARRIEKLQTLATELRERYRIDVIVEQVDLSAITAVVDLHKRLRERGITIDILINNAGLTRATPRWLHRAIFSRLMGAGTDRGDTYTASVGVARR